MSSIHYIKMQWATDNIHLHIKLQIRSRPIWKFSLLCIFVFQVHESMRVQNSSRIRMIIESPIKSAKMEMVKMKTSSARSRNMIFTDDICHMFNGLVYVTVKSRFNLKFYLPCKFYSWWRHQMETFSALLAICAGNSPVSGEFPAQRPVTPSFDIFFDLRLNKRLSKQWWGWWFETLSCPLWRQCTVEIRTRRGLSGAPDHIHSHNYLYPAIGYRALVPLAKSNYFVKNMQPE